MVKTPRKITLIEGVIAWIGSVPSMIFHTCVFSVFFVLTVSFANSRDIILLVWNTIVSLEAIYLAIFIQFTVNSNTQSLREVEEDIDEIQEDVEELGEDIDEIQEDIDEIQEDVEELNEEDVEEDKREEQTNRSLDKLTEDMRHILAELEALKRNR